MSAIGKRLESLGIVLPRPALPVANYVPVTRVWRLAFVSGQLPIGPDGKIAPAHMGPLGPKSSIEHAREAARLAAINVLAQLNSELSTLDRVASVVRLGGFFAVDGPFEQLPQAMNGASNLMAEIFDDSGRHARTTVGVAYLPMNAVCEVEGIFEIEY